MGASKSAGEQIVGLAAEWVVVRCFCRFLSGLQVILGFSSLLDPVGAFGGF